MATLQPASGEAGPQADAPVGAAAGAHTEVSPAIAAVDKNEGVRAGGEESSAAHLAGSSSEAIHDVDVKFEHLLATVHENRPGDDLDIIRRAWAFCLQQHEGQKRASGEPYIIHP